MFHANPVEEGGCGPTRQTFVQRVTWGVDGMPELGGSDGRRDGDGGAFGGGERGVNMDGGG